MFQDVKKEAMITAKFKECVYHYSKKIFFSFFFFSSSSSSSFCKQYNVFDSRILKTR